jgi:hypothetical protein
VRLQGAEHAGGGWKPGIQDVGIDNLVTAVQRVESLTNGGEEGAPVETSGLREKEIEPPFRAALEPVEQTSVPSSRARISATEAWSRS